MGGDRRTERAGPRQDTLGEAGSPAHSQTPLPEARVSPSHTDSDTTQEVEGIAKILVLLETCWESHLRKHTEMVLQITNCSADASPCLTYARGLIILC